MAVTLELKEKKYNAHSDYICSVAYSPDGTKIVSGSDDQTIKVWDAGAFWGPKRQNTHLASADASLVCLAATLELKATKEDAHSRVINSVAYSPDGTKIVSGSGDQTIKVWDAGAFLGPNCQDALLA